MRTVALRGRVVTDHEVWPEGTVLLEENRIAGVSRGSLNAGEVHEYPDCLITPGFVDLQVNGFSGIDVATEPGRVPELSRRLAATGATSYLPTLISSPKTIYREALPKLAELARENVAAEVLGMHLEGPFVNLERKGAHPADCIIPADTELLEELLDLGPVRMLTLAPEIEGATKLMNAAARRGVVISAGHSNATFECAYEAFEKGVTSVTHLFNAMSPLHQREPGLSGAALSHPRALCGIIADGRHVHPAVVDIAFRLLGPDRLYLVTDSIAATGAEPSEYALATRQVHLDAGGFPTLEDGTLAGGALAMNEALKNVLAFTGCTVPEAIRMAATTPAKLIGEGGRKGRFAPGYDADVVVLRSDLSIEAVYREGERL